MRSLVSLASVVVLGVGVAGSVRAEPPAGDYETVVAGEAEIWQPGGAWEFCDTAEDVQVCLSVDGSTDTSGIVNAVGTFTFTGIAEGELVAPISGEMKGSTEKSKVALEGPLQGELTVTGIPVDIDGNIKLNCKENTLDPAFFDCKPKVKLCAYEAGKKLGCEKVGGKSGEASVPAVGGPWALRMALSTDASGNVTGDAEVELATGQILAFTASGKYKSKSDSSKLTLVGVGPAANSKLKLSKLVLSGGTTSAGKASFKLAGQKGKAELVPLN